MTVLQTKSGTWTGTTFTATFDAASSPSNRVLLIVAANTTVATQGAWQLRQSQINFMGHYLFDQAGGGTSYTITSAAGQGTWVLQEVSGGVYDTGNATNTTSVDITYATPAITPTAGLRVGLASIASTTADSAPRTVSGWTNGYTELADLCYVGADYPMQGVASTADFTATGAATTSTAATYSGNSTGRSALIASYVTATPAAAAPAFDPGAFDAGSFYTADGGTTPVNLTATINDNIGGTDQLTDVDARARTVTDTAGLTDATSQALTRTLSDTAAATDTLTGVTAPSYFQQALWLWDPIIATPALDAQSSSIVASLAQGQHSCALSDFAAAIRGPAEITAQTPRYDILFKHATGNGGDEYGPDPIPAGETVAIPANVRLPTALPENGGDSHYAVADPTVNRVYELWQADFDDADGIKRASWGGWSSLDGDGRSEPGGGSTGSGINRFAAVIREAEIASGLIKHALFFGTDMARYTEFRYPARATDGRNLNNLPVTIPEGARVQLDPTIDLAAIPGITPAELTIGRALQTYGAYCGDNGGARMGFVFEVPQNPASTVYADKGLAYDYFDLTHIPWSSMRVLASWDGQAVAANLSKTVSDSLGLTDSLSAAAVRVRTVTDACTGADTVAAVRTFDRAVADGLPATDAVTVTRTVDRIVADVLAATDALTVERSTSVSDAAAGTDTLAAFADRTSLLADTLTATDAVTVEQAGAVAGALADALGGTDTLTTQATRDASLADAVASTDALVGAYNRPAVLSDQGAGADSLTSTAARAATLSDTATGSDSVTGPATRAGTQADAAALSDAFTADRAVTASDPLPGTDALLLTATRAAELADNAAGSDALSSSRAGAVDTSLADAAQITDVLSATRTVALTVTDTAAITDGISVARSVAVADNLAGSDASAPAATRARTLADSAAGADSLDAARAGAQERELTDTVGLSDALTVSFGRAATLTDAVAISDPDTPPGGYEGGYEGGYASPGVPTDRTRSRQATVADPLAVLDQIEAQWARAAILTDQAGGTDRAGTGRGARLTDTLTVEDALAIFAGQPRDLDLELALSSDRYTLALTGDRYAVGVTADRLTVGVGGDRYASNVGQGRYEARVT